MTENEMIIKICKHTMKIMDLEDTVYDLQVEIYKLKNPNYKEIDLIKYQTKLLDKRLGKDNGTD